MLIPKNLYCLYISPATITSRSVTQNFFYYYFSWTSYRCQIFADVPCHFWFIFFIKLKKHIKRSKPVCNFQSKLIGSQLADNNNKLVLARLDFLWYLAIRWLSTKIKVCFKIKMEDCTTFLNTNFPNFDVSEKKSADFSCLFTFLIEFRNSLMSLLNSKNYIIVGKN